MDIKLSEESRRAILNDYRKQISAGDADLVTLGSDEMICDSDADEDFSMEENLSASREIEQELWKGKVVPPPTHKPYFTEELKAQFLETLDKEIDRIDKIIARKDSKKEIMDR